LGGLSKRFGLAIGTNADNYYRNFRPMTDLEIFY